MRRKPPDPHLVNAVQRIQVFSAALVEQLTLQQLPKWDNTSPSGSITFHQPQDQQVLAYLVQFANAFPNQLHHRDFPETLLLSLWLAECRASELGHLLEGETRMPYQTQQKGHFVYKAAWPTSLYPMTCLACGASLYHNHPNPRKLFCRESCRSSWSTLKEQFARISKLVTTKRSVLNEYGTLLNAYSLFINNPHYNGYAYKDPKAHQHLQKMLDKGMITLFKDKKGKPVDLQGNPMPEAYLITDLEIISA